METCECGALALYTLKNGRHCCSPSVNQCPAVRERHSTTKKGKKPEKAIAGWSLITCRYCGREVTSPNIEKHENACKTKEIGKALKQQDGNCTFCGNYYRRVRYHEKYCIQNPNRQIRIQQGSNPKAKKLDELVQQWAQGIDVTESISCEGKTIKGEMKNPVKQRIKAFLLEEQNHRCCICGQVDSWNNQPLDFILDHIDGNPYNHLKTNLRLVCPHCESQLPTHVGRNRGHGRFSVRYQYNRYNNINN